MQKQKAFSERDPKESQKKESFEKSCQHAESGKDNDDIGDDANNGNGDDD